MLPVGRLLEALREQDLDTKKSKDDYEYKYLPGRFHLEKRG